MRSVDVLARSIAVVVVCAAMSGCASLGDLFSGRRPSGADPTRAPAATVNADAGKPAVTSGAASASRPAAATVTPARSDGAPVDPNAQRAFDAARRALAAGRLEDAERGFRALTVSNPELGGPYANLGLIYRRTGKYAESVAALEQATRLSPTQARYFNQLGISYRYAGQFEKAREAYRQALALAPDDATVCLNLGILYDLYLWDAPQAQVYYERYLALTPGGDATVGKWITDLKNRKGKAPAADAPKEQS
jgi:Flp pilus assembly protein TadD